MSKTKTAAITGVCGGIGSALMQGLLRKGYRILGVDVNLSRLEQFQQDHGEAFIPFQADLMSRAARKAVAQDILEQYGVPDIWFNNAGIAHIDTFLDTEEAVFDRVMELNLNAVIDLSRFWLKAMKDVSHGTLVNIASCAGHIPVPNLSAYAASKHGVVGFTQSIQEELRFERSQVKAILVSPGFVNTDIIQLGKDNGFPPILSFALDKPETCAQEIIRGVLKGHQFITPTLNGKVLMGLNRVSPEATRLSSHLLVAPQLKDLFGFFK